MDEPRCDFYDWASRRSCHEPATWVTHQFSVKAARSVRYYCDTHRPPRARRLGSGRRLAPKKRHRSSSK